jgi:hypothetical protein
VCLNDLHDLSACVFTELNLAEFDIGDFKGSKEELFKAIHSNVMFPSVSSKWSGKRKASFGTDDTSISDRNYVIELLLIGIVAAILGSYVKGYLENKRIAAEWSVVESSSSRHCVIDHAHTRAQVACDKSDLAQSIRDVS